MSEVPVIRAVGDIATAGEFGQFIVQRMPARRAGGDLLQQRRVAAVRIQQRQLRSARKQGLLRVLAVDLDQQGSQLSQLRHTGQASVDPRLGTAIGA